MALIVELRRMNDEDLKDLLEDARDEMFNLRFQKASGTLEDTARLTLVRREIAQLNEVLRKREMAIERAAQHAEIAAVLKGEEWQATAYYVYEDGAWFVTFTDSNDVELATALIDLNAKRRKTRRARSTKKPKRRVLQYEIPG